LVVCPSLTVSPTRHCPLTVPPTCHLPTCPALSLIFNLSPTCPPHTSSHYRCLSTHVSYLSPSPSILPTSCPPMHRPVHLMDSSTPSPHHLHLHCLTVHHHHPYHLAASRPPADMPAHLHPSSMPARFLCTPPTSSTLAPLTRPSFPTQPPHLLTHPPGNMSSPHLLSHPHDGRVQPAQPRCCATLHGQPAHPRLPQPTICHHGWPCTGP